MKKNNESLDKFFAQKLHETKSTQFAWEWLDEYITQKYIQKFTVQRIEEVIAKDQEMIE